MRNTKPKKAYTTKDLSGFEKTLNRIREDAKCRNHLVNKEHHNWVPTEEIAEKLKAEYPALSTPWLEKEHIHGVKSTKC